MPSKDEATAAALERQANIIAELQATVAALQDKVQASGEKAEPEETPLRFERRALMAVKDGGEDGYRLIRKEEYNPQEHTKYRGDIQAPRKEEEDGPAETDAVAAVLDEKRGELLELSKADLVLMAEEAGIEVPNRASKAAIADLLLGGE